ncbi:MAG: hypothetical protein GWM88_18480 [Pseudomonadales bacterium]|nr:sterol desaturase family protein [Pseudomonadales bacterium]NIX09911.1 hypothetical protein [Pseudomonadales bacterium]
MLSALADWISSNYVTVVIGSFLLIVLLETLAPGRAPQQSVVLRWWRNFSIGFTSQLVTAGLGFILAAVVSFDLDATSGGLLALSELPAGFTFLLTLLILDGCQWGFHKAMHSFDWCWRIHQVHHCDGDFDVSTAWRFHPAEALLSQLMLIALVMVVGIGPEVLLLRGALAYLMNFFTHANARLPEGLDYALRYAIVTPAMHRIHHSREPDDQHSNFGSIFSFWDRAFRSYRKRSCGDPLVPVGLDSHEHPETLGAWRLLRMPFDFPSRSDARLTAHP